MNDIQLFSPYQSRRAFQEIAKEIKQAILAKRLKSGDRLPSERALAQQFQVGRLTIREALRTLETNGLIKIKYGRGGGTFVGAPDPMRLPSMVIDNLLMEGLSSDQMTEARVGLERTIVKYAIKHATQKDLNHIDQNIRESKEIMRSESRRDILKKMIEFHIFLGEASHNLPFIMFIRTLMDWARRKLSYWSPTFDEQMYSYESHKLIFESIKVGDINLAQRRVEDHIIHMTDLVTKNREPNGPLTIM